MIHGEKPCPTQSPSVLLRGFPRSSHILTDFLKHQSCTCDTVCLCWRAPSPKKKMSANPTEPESLRILLPEEGEADRAFCYSPSFPDPPRTQITGMHSTDLCLSFFQWKSDSRCNCPALLLSLCVINIKYGHSCWLLKLGRSLEHLVNRRKAAWIKNKLKKTTSQDKTTRLCPNTPTRSSHSTRWIKPFPCHAASGLCATYSA